MVSLLVLLDSLYGAVVLGIRGLGATLGGENTSPWSSIVSTLAPPPPSPFLPLSPLMARAASSSSNSFWRLIASTCLTLLFSSRTRSISTKSSCTWSWLEGKAEIHVCVCVDVVWCVMDGCFLFPGIERVCQHSWSGFWIKASVAPLCLWRRLLLQGPGLMFSSTVSMRVFFFQFFSFLNPCIWKLTDDTLPQGKSVRNSPSLLVNAKSKTGLFLTLKCLNKHAWAHKQSFGFGRTKQWITPH